MVDLQLEEQDTLWGQLVDSQGVPQVDVPVALYARDHRLAIARTDKRGYFAFSGLASGMYQVVAPQAQATYRLWESQIAPPSARRGGILLVTNSPTVRGQVPQMLRKPWVVAGVGAAVVAVAVAVPLSLRDDDDDWKPASP